MVNALPTTQQQVLAAQNAIAQGIVQPRDNSLLNSLNPAKNVTKSQEIKEKEQILEEEEEQGRHNYGLSLIDLMSDAEYAAFERITANMTYGEKMMSAQSLYRLTSLQMQEGANYPKEMKNGYGNTHNFGDKFAKAIAWGDVSLDQRS